MDSLKNPLKYFLVNCIFCTKNTWFTIVRSYAIIFIRVIGITITTIFLIVTNIFNKCRPREFLSNASWWFVLRTIRIIEIINNRKFDSISCRTCLCYLSNIYITKVNWIRTTIFSIGRISIYSIFYI